MAVVRRVTWGSSPALGSQDFFKITMQEPRFVAPMRSILEEERIPARPKARSLQPIASDLLPLTYKHRLIAADL